MNFDRLFHRRSRSEHLGDAESLELRLVVVGDDPAHQYEGVLERVVLFEPLDYLRHEGTVRSREDRDAEDVHVLLDRRLDDVLRRPVQPGVDDLEAGVAERPRDHVCTPVVAV